MPMGVNNVSRTSTVKRLNSVFLQIVSSNVPFIVLDIIAVDVGVSGCE